MSSEKIRTPALPNVPAMPATVATSFFRKRSDDMVITVTDKCLVREAAEAEQRDRGVRAFDEPDEGHADHQTARRQVNAQRRALIRLTPRRSEAAAR